MRPEPPLICVTGPDGSGKTTQIARLAERLEGRGKVKAAAVTIWDLLLDPASRGRVAFRTPAEVDSYLEILHPTSRALFLYHCLYEALRLALRRKAQVLLLNAYWYKYYAVEVAHGGSPEELRSLARIFPQPALTFYLRVDPEEAFRRKAGLSGYETGFASPRSREAFVSFQGKAQEALHSLALELGFVELNGRESPDSLAERILERIQQEALC